MDEPKKIPVKLILILAGAVALLAAVTLLIVKVVIPKVNYQKLVNEYGAEKAAVLSRYQSGETLKFGRYEQDNNTTNGAEEIAWKVLDIDGNRMLLLSEKGLDCKRYHDEYSGAVWENCSLRAWLNETFYETAFSEEEKQRILLTDVTADPNPEHKTDPGNDTKDHVFLLSIKEAKEYFKTKASAECIPTAYAIAQGAQTSEFFSDTREATSWWWLRTSGYISSWAAQVNLDGSVSNAGFHVQSGDGSVRPAIWITMEP